MITRSQKAIGMTNKTSGIFFSVFFTVSLFVFLISGPTGEAQASNTDEFEAEGVTWSVQLEDLESFNSEFDTDALKVVNENGEPGYSQSAWIGNDPGDLGFLWVIQDKEGVVLGACWRYYDDPDLECTPLYMPVITSFDNLDLPLD